MKIHRFSAGSEHLCVFGDRGAGPGEFGRIASAVVAGNRVLVWDGSLLRLNIFNLLGRFDEQRPLPSQSGELRRLNLVVPLDLGADSPLIGVSAYGLLGSAGSAPATTVYDSHLHIYLLSPDLEIAKVLVDSIQSRQTAYLGTGDIVYAEGPPAYGRSGCPYAVSTELPIAFTFVDYFRVDFLAPETSERWATTIDMNLRPITSSEKEAEFARWDDRDLGQQARRFLVFAEHHPAITALQWDGEGRLWVRGQLPETDSEPIPYQVLDQEGRWLFSQSLPALPLIFTDGGFFSSSEDDSGNPTVTFYRLISVK